MTAEATQTRYVSDRHPGDAPASVVFGRRFVIPLGTCMLPVMIGAMTSMLQGFGVLHFLYWGFPLATVVAFVWTWIRIRDEVVEIRLHEDAAAVLSLIAAAGRTRRLTWIRILDVVPGEDRLRVTLGHEEIRIVRKDWPDYDEIERLLLARFLHRSS